MQLMSNQSIQPLDKYSKLTALVKIIISGIFSLKPWLHSERRICFLWKSRHGIFVGHNEFHQLTYMRRSMQCLRRPAKAQGEFHEWSSYINEYMDEALSCIKSYRITQLLICQTRDVNYLTLIHKYVPCKQYFLSNARLKTGPHRHSRDTHNKEKRLTITDQVAIP